MLRLRPYKSSDATEILSWCTDERSFYQWSAGVLGQYPITQNEFRFVENLMPFVAFDENGLVGFFTFRVPNKNDDEMRLGFVIVDPLRRGTGLGKKMILLGLRFAFNLYGAKKVTLGVFENNLPAYHCYKSCGFFDVATDVPETYSVLGEEWVCRELCIEKSEL